MSLTSADLPDFDAIAEAFARHLTAQSTRGYDATDLEWLKTNLRNVWNTRGAADAKVADAVLTSSMGVTAAGPYVKNLERALKDLDQQ